MDASLPLTVTMDRDSVMRCGHWGIKHVMSCRGRAGALVVMCEQSTFKHNITYITLQPDRDALIANCANIWSPELTS